MVTILLLILPRVLLLCSSQDAGSTGLTEFIPWDARLLRSHGRQGERDAQQQRCSYSANPCQEGLAANRTCAMGKDGMRCSPQN